MNKLLKNIIFATLLVMLGVGITLTIIGAVKDNSSPYKMSKERVNTMFYTEDIFHDQAYIYMYPLEPLGTDEVTLRIKTRYGSILKAGINYTFDLSGTPIYYYSPMQFEKRDETGYYEYWIGKVPANDAPYKYHFKLENEKETIYFNKDGINTEALLSSGSDYYVMPNFNTPDWSKGALWYSIMPESFFNGDVLNDKTGAEWETSWGNTNSWAGEWNGGDLIGIEKQLDHLADLNIDALFLNPFWITAHNAGYGTYDFTQVDSALGNDKILKSLIDSLHDNNIKVMLDAVFEYVNVNNMLASVSDYYPNLHDVFNEDSPFYDFVQRDSDGNVIYSYWGSPKIDFSKKVVREYIYDNADSLMQAFINQFGVDGWRMDVGSTLSGTDEDNWGNATQILKDMRRYLKDDYEDILFLSEHADINQLTDYVLDTKWNYNFYYPLIDWVKGVSNANVLSNSLSSAVLSLPRSVANSSYNFLTTHDMPRMLDVIGGDEITFGAAQILLLNYVGAACIYYGEEVGVRTPSVINDTETYSFYSAMEWDESSYNYYIYNLTKSLTDLRKEYELVYKDGAYMTIYDEGLSSKNPHDIFAFARFNENGKIISAINKTNDIVKNFELNVRKLSIKDGTILLDYLSGREYKVVNGKVLVDIYPSGIVLVEGGSKHSLGDYNLFNINDSSAKISKGTNLNEFILEGSGSIGNNDSLNFANQAGFNNFSLNYQLNSIEKDSQALFMVRESEDPKSAFYGIIVEKNKIRQVYRSQYGGAITYGSTVTINENQTIKLERTSGSLFKIYVDDSEFKAFSVYIDMNEKAYYGVSPLRGKMVVSTHEYNINKDLLTNFDNNKGSLLTYYGNNILTYSKGLILDSNNDKDLLLSTMKTTDYTFRSKLAIDSIEENGYAGITVYQNEDNYLFLGVENGYKLSLVQFVNGTKRYIESMDLQSKEVILQLEKVGTTYKALYSVDNGQTFETLGYHNINYSKMQVGIINENAKTTYKYFAIGDGIQAITDYQYFKEIDFSFDEYIESKGITPKYTTSSNSDFEVIWGGVRQTSTRKEIIRYDYGNGNLGSFQATFTFSIEEYNDNESYAGVIVGRNLGSNALYMQIHQNGVIKFVRNNIIINETTIDDFSLKQEYLFRLIVDGEKISLYIGEDPKLLTQFTTTFNTKTNFSWFSYGASFTLKNYSVYTKSGDWFVQRGGVNVSENTFDPAMIDLELSGLNNNNYISMRKDGLSDFMLGYNLQLVSSNIISRGFFDVIIGNKSGANNFAQGLVVRMDNRGTISLFNNGFEIVRYEEIPGMTTGSCYIVVKYQNQKLNIYLANFVAGKNNYSKEDLSLVFTYDDTENRGGGLAFYTQNADAKLIGIKGYGIKKNINYEGMELFQNFYIDNPIPPQKEPETNYLNDTYYSDFSTKDALGDYFRYSGTTTIKNNDLIINGYSPENWDAGVAFGLGKVKDFKVDFKVKIQHPTDNGSFAGVEFYKDNPSGNHQGKALSLVIYKSGWANIFVGNGISTSYGINLVANQDGYYEISLQVVDGIITISSGANTVSVAISVLPNNNNLEEGYLSFNVGNNIGYFKDIIITPL